MAVSPGSALSLNQISLRRRWVVLGSDSLMVTSYGNMRVEVLSTSDFNPAKIKSGRSHVIPLRIHRTKAAQAHSAGQAWHADYRGGLWPRPCIRSLRFPRHGNGRTQLRG